MNECFELDAIINQLKRIEGHVRGIINMIEGGNPYEEIIIQIGSVKAALRKTGQVVLEWHLHHWVLDSIREDKEEETVKKCSSAIEQFSRI